MLFFMDTETGGLDPSRHSLLEVCITAYDEIKKEQVETLQFYVKQDEYIVTPQAMGINGLRLEHCHSKGVTKEGAVQALADFAYRHGGTRTMIAGHNVNFDRQYLIQLFKEVNRPIDKVFSYRVMDTAGIIRFLITIGKLPYNFPQSLHKAAETLGIQIENAHTGTDDVRVNIELFEKLCALAKG